MMRLTHLPSTRSLTRLSPRFAPSFLAGPFAAALVAVAWLYPVPAANAQTQPQTPGAAGQADNIPEQKLDAAAAAIQKMASVKQEYQQRISKEASPAEQERLAEEGNNAMEKAVTDQGLSVEEYNSIIQVAQNDPQVRQKILSRVKTK